MAYSDTNSLHGKEKTKKTSVDEHSIAETIETANSQTVSNTPSLELNVVSRTRTTEYPSGSVLKTAPYFEPEDPKNPLNFKGWKRYHVMLAGIMTALNSTLGTSLATGATEHLSEAFNITSEAELVLPISAFLWGYMVGPLFCGPLSETYGRKIIMTLSSTIYAIFMLACAVSDTWGEFLAFRFFCGLWASAPIAIFGGLYADIYNDPRRRGRALAEFNAMTACGPILGPPISGFISEVSWRWPFWIGLIFASITLPVVFTMPETYAPVLLQRRAKEMQSTESNGNSSTTPVKPHQGPNPLWILMMTLMRPIDMFLHEPIVLFTCLYIALVQTIFFLSFQSYPIVFEGIYGMSAGVSGLLFLPMLPGVFMACAIFLLYDNYLYRAKYRHAPWSLIEEYRRLPLACFGGPFFVISMFWMGWSASVHTHWAIPMISGVPFGLGYQLILMAMLNYLTDAYEIYAASAQSASSITRNMSGSLLPLGAKQMYRTLGVNWTCSLLGFASLAMSAIPFAFIYYGERLRGGSKFFQSLKKIKEAREQEKVRLQERSKRAMNGDDVDTENN
ncbi:MAG: hypothetical protein M1834_002015 [Cirrosporium novae-zelandiae]|nr:MAG: hypothetical protein M1834_002015 [Cirrosporium novae-zelandiae]